MAKGHQSKTKAHVMLGLNLYTHRNGKLGSSLVSIVPSRLHLYCRPTRASLSVSDVCLDSMIAAHPSCGGSAVQSQLRVWTVYIRLVCRVSGVCKKKNKNSSLTWISNPKVMSLVGVCLELQTF